MKFYYRTSSVAFAFAVPAAILAVLVWSPGESTYFAFLDRYPGRALIWVLVGIGVLLMMPLLPHLMRAAARIPAVEFDGTTLLVRGWEDRFFNTDHDDIRFDVVDQRITISASGRPKACISLKHIDGPTSLVRFLDTVVVGRS